MSTRETPRPRADYQHFMRIATRWSDNDSYRHVNNVVYYSFFDTAVNRFLIENDALSLEESPVIGLVASTRCQFFKSLSFPEEIDVGLRVARLGGASIRYDIAIFRLRDESAAAQGEFVHVYVDRVAQTPAPIPERVRAAVVKLCAPPKSQQQEEDQQ